jgi:hypothetical protein
MAADEPKGAGGAGIPHSYRAWTWGEAQEVWRHPDMTARELHELVPRHSVRGITEFRKRQGRWRTEGVIPLCQRCGQRPVAMTDPQAKRWGLCMACAMDEREWRERNAEGIRKRGHALNVRLSNKRKRKRER